MKNKLKSIFLMSLVASGMFLGTVSKASAMEKISPVRASVVTSGVIGGSVIIGIISYLCVFDDDEADDYEASTYFKPIH